MVRVLEMSAEVKNEIPMIGKADPKALLLNMANEAHDYTDVMVLARRKDGFIVIGNTTISFERMSAMFLYLQKFMMSSCNVFFK